MTILFGVVARLPFAFAAGMGLNSFVATTLVGSLTWPEAMGLVVINGLIIVILAATGLRRLVFDAVPMQLKLAITAGIGLFITVHRARRRRLHRLDRRAVAARRPRRRRHRFDQHRADARIRAHAPGDGRSRRPAGARRHPHRTRGGHRRRGRHRGDLAPRLGGRAARRLESVGADIVRLTVRPARSVARRRVQPGRLSAASG